MKYKIIIIIVLGTLFTSIIYFYTDKDNLNVLALGDGISTGMTSYHIEGYDYNEYLIEYLNENKQLEHYYKNFNEVDETASSLLNKINNNIESIDRIKIKQAIKEADIITLTLGMDELNNYAKKSNLGSTKISGYLNKYKEVLQALRKLNNNNIYLVGLYETTLLNETKVKKVNEELKNLCKQYNVTYIDIEDIIENKDFFTSEKEYYLNYKGQEYIFNKIRDTFDTPTMNII